MNLEISDHSKLRKYATRIAQLQVVRTRSDRSERGNEQGKKFQVFQTPSPIMIGKMCVTWQRHQLRRQESAPSRVCTVKSLASRSRRQEFALSRVLDLGATQACLTLKSSPALASKPGCSTVTRFLFYFDAATSHAHSFFTDAGHAGKRYEWAVYAKDAKDEPVVLLMIVTLTSETRWEKRTPGKGSVRGDIWATQNLNRRPRAREICASHLDFLAGAKPTKWLAKPTFWLASRFAGRGRVMPPKATPTPETSQFARAQASLASQKVNSRHEGKSAEPCRAMYLFHEEEARDLEV
ncbi:hypothetical protein DFH06DRAFT_1151260 [Mycena polygramma]|nr:hypothetical protein DFH06DRAFT_1151260 [Mycena polygramma]